MNTQTPFVWNDQVANHELDIQNIVNNAVYLTYFDRARINYLLSKGIDWKEWHHNGFNLVLIHVNMEIKNSLKANDHFYIKSTCERSGRLKVIFHQNIFRTDDDRLIARAVNTIACVSLASGKPVMPKELLSLLF